jgi:hypothetical protein
MSRQQQKQTEEYRNFKELTKNLLAVPKKEYDKKHVEFEKKSKKEKPAK